MSLEVSWDLSAQSTERFLRFSCRGGWALWIAKPSLCTRIITVILFISYCYPLDRTVQRSSNIAFSSNHNEGIFLRFFPGKIMLPCGFDSENITLFPFMKTTYPSTCDLPPPSVRVCLGAEKPKNRGKKIERKGTHSATTNEFRVRCLLSHSHTQLTRALLLLLRIAASFTFLDFPGS